MLAHREFVRTVVVCLGVCAAAGVGPAAQKAKGVLDPDRVPRMQRAELQRLLAKDQAIVVDVRSEQAFAAGHLEGALHVPAREIAAQASTLKKQAGSRHIVLYCSCPFEYSAAEAAVTLARLGLTKVSVLAGGYRLTALTAGPS
jgi:hydroxyacylglutathione hydrolase